MFGKRGKKEGVFDYPVYIAVDAKGRVWIWVYIVSQYSPLMVT